jgi:hypothetical protein
MAVRVCLTEGVVLLFEGAVARVDLIIFLKHFLRKARSHNLELEFLGGVLLGSNAGSVVNRTGEATEIYTWILFHEGKSESWEFLIRVYAPEDNPEPKRDIVFVEFVFARDPSICRVSSHLREEAIDMHFVLRAPS